MPPFAPSLLRKDRVLSLLSIALLLATGVVLLVYAAVFANPNLVPARLRPPTPVPTFTLIGPVTPSPTDLVLVANTATATPSATEPAPTHTPTATSTRLVPDSTVTPKPTTTETYTPTLTLIPTETPTPTPTPTITPSQFRYTVQPGYPKYGPYPGGCQWLGFSGQVFDLSGHPVIDAVVHIGGVDYLTLSGASQEYNILGWAQKVSDQPASTQSYYFVQLQDALGNPLSAQVVLTTANSCAQNLITINFIQNH